MNHSIVSQSSYTRGISSTCKHIIHWVTFFFYEFVRLEVPIEEYLGSWKQSQAIGRDDRVIPARDVSCIGYASIEYANVRIKCSFQSFQEAKSNVHIFTKTTSDLPFQIQDGDGEVPPKIKGIINMDGRNITWYEGTKFFATWTRPIRKFCLIYKI